jgi:hypothetical protein
MITEDLIAYIQAQLRKNISKELISSRLSKAGWHADDIEEGLRKVIPPPIQRTEPVVPKQNPPSLIIPQSPELEAPTPKVTAPVAKLNLQDSIALQAKEILAPVFVAPPLNLPVESMTDVDPFATSPSKDLDDEFDSEIEYTPTNSDPVTYVIPKKVQPIVIEKPALPPTPTVAPTPPVPKKEEEFIPKLIPKNQVPEVFIPIAVVTPTPTQSNIPQGALIASYAEDLSTASLVRNVRPEQKHKRSFKLILIVILVLVVLGGVVFTFASGMLSFVKKDTKVMLLRAPINFAMHDSYKSVTKATLSLPSIANITTGLVSGEVVNSDDVDSISIQTEGLINQHSGTTTSLSYRTTFKSSITKESVVVDMKYDGANSFIAIPNISAILGPNAPKVPSVSIPKGKFGLLAPVLPPYFANKITMVDIDKILSKRIDPYANTDTGLAFKEFVGSAYIIERSPESIGIVPTYHYQINADRQATKKLLSAITNFFLSSLSDDVKNNIEDGLATATLDTFEVWIGKKDNNIHQYKLSMSMPLSKAIGLDDKGIAGNKVTLDWVTTFSDFDIANNIVMPEGSVTIEAFMKKIEDMKLQDTIVKLRPVTVNLFNSEGSFGKSNPSGSCMEPIPGSLFSPNSHPRGSTTAVGNIASIMNTILGITMDSGSCYSTPVAWAAAFPLPSKPSSYFCVDSSDYSRVTDVPLTGAVCK